MFIKLGIIVGIVILGGMIFSTEIGNIFPTTSATVFDSLMDDITGFGSKASDSVDQRLDESIDKIVDKTSNSITNEISEAGDNIANEISEAKKSSQKTITEEISNFNPIEAITNIFTGTSGSPSTTSPSTTSPSTTSPIIYETLSLSTKQQSDDNILLQYSDSSGKTQSVNVVIRTEQKEIFSGTFFTSMFETTVNDASGIPYYVDMIVEHEDYGTISSSVFNTGDDSDTKINGIFSQQ
jgi:hypothetical protein